MYITYLFYFIWYQLTVFGIGCVGKENHENQSKGENKQRNKVLQMAKEPLKKALLKKSKALKKEQACKSSKPKGNTIDQISFNRSEINKRTSPPL